MCVKMIFQMQQINACVFAPFGSWSLHIWKKTISCSDYYGGKPVWVQSKAAKNT